MPDLNEKLIVEIISGTVPNVSDPYSIESGSESSQKISIQIRNFEPGSGSKLFLTLPVYENNLNYR